MTKAVGYPKRLHDQNRREAVAFGLAAFALAYGLTFGVAWISLEFGWLSLVIAPIEFLFRRDFSSQRIWLFCVVMVGGFAAVMTAQYLL